VTFVRSLLSDLIARRLWPVAIVLVGALVAVPVLLGPGGDDAPLPSASADGPLGSSPLVSLAADAPRGGASTTGRNPFSQRDVAPAPERTTGSAPGAGGSDSGSAGGADVGGGFPGLGDIDVVPVGGGSTPTPSPNHGSDGGANRDSYSIDVRIGRDGRLQNREDVPRLSPLPSDEDPFFVYLGVLADGETALFLVSSDATPTGDGTCRPNPENCQRVELKAGQTEFFDVTTPEGQTVQYQLDLLRVSRKRSATPGMAIAARTRESETGRELLRNAVETGQVDVSGLAYSRKLGLVVPTGEEAGEQSGGLFGGFRVDLQFGAPGALVKRYHLARLTPLPSVAEPSFVYLGVLGDGETVLFLNPSEARASGDAVCQPSPEQCQRVEMKAGNSALFDVPLMSGQTTEYQLDIDAVTPLRGETPEQAADMRRRESPAGRVILRRLIGEVGDLVEGLSFSSKTGTVVDAD
jgi:hypothetical protein